MTAVNEALNVSRFSGISEPLIMDAPPFGPNLRLRDFEEFVTARHMAGVCSVKQTDVFVQLTKQLKEKAQQPVSLTGIYATSGSGMVINNVTPADPVVLHNSPNVESLQFVLYSGLPMPPSISFSASCTFKPSGNSHLALDWLRSDENGKKLVDPKSGVVFPKLKPFWERIADMGADNATLFLQERIEATTRGTLSLFGVSVDRDLILLAGPAALFALMLFFLLHLRHVNAPATWSKYEIESTRDYPWIACLKTNSVGRQHTVASSACLSVQVCFFSSNTVN